MNQRQKEIQQEFLNSEKAVLKKLEQGYKDALSEINSKIELLLARKDADMQHVIYQVEYQKALKSQVAGILERLQADEFETVSEYLTKSYEDGFLGVLYDLQGQGIPLVFPLDQKQVVTAIQHETKLSAGLYASLGKDIKVLSKEIAGEISRGISNAAMYSEIARNIAGYAGIGKNKAMRIARTEAHRIQCQAAADAQWKAQEKGADVVKQWDATLDGNTRDTHRELDGQIRELDKPFECSGGSAMQPGGFGNPAEDCNCRCALLQRARWALDESELGTLKERAEYFGLDKAEDFEDFKEKYLNVVEKSDKSSKITDTDKKAIFDYMGSMSYVVNEKLRNGSKLTALEQKFVNNLDNALDKMPTYAGTLQRSLLFYSDEAVEEFMNRHKVDNIVTYSEFISTTKGEIYNPDGQVQIYIQDAKKGKDISAINEKEDEILYKRNTSFAITNVVKRDGIYYILAVENDE